MHHGQTVRGALSYSVPFPDIWNRQTDGVAARASGRIKELEKNNAAGKIAELERRAWHENASGLIRPLPARVESEVRDDIPNFVVRLCLSCIEPAVQP